MRLVERQIVPDPVVEASDHGGAREFATTHARAVAHRFQQLERVARSAEAGK